MSDATSDTPETDADVFGLSTVRELLRLIGQSDITEILIERGETKLHVKRGHSIVAPQPMALAPLMQQPMAPMPLPGFPVQPLVAPAAAPEGPPVELPAGHTITAPMVGTFYSAASPKDPPFVQEGDEVRAGDSIGIIEAMKMMNEIETDFAGRVARVLVKNGQPVEYGQPLLVIEPL
ncbi:MAG: acetyl-CoA carboxylase biotin carboxyl carrier protein [Chloroflexales bacterium]|nr:acetyl-CoA carboxylase biotin carboxyl carrier protein [Chloroflexales bacterium]